MLKISPSFSRKWLQNFKETLISSISAVVFLFLDFVDVVFCVFFRLVDLHLESKRSRCYCYVQKEEEKSVTNDIDGENELSETNYKRRNVFREMGFVGNCSKRKKEWRKVNENVRWSDCGCKNCVSWMSNGTELKLHVVVKELEHGTSHNVLISVQERRKLVLNALNRLAERRLWPPLLFGSSFMSWYEHLGRCVCYIIRKNHRMWEGILKLLTWNRNLHFMAIDLTRHTHHSAWHTMHNVICGGAKFMDKYLETPSIAKVKINVTQGSRDQVVPLECSNNIKMKVPDVVVKIVANADHTSVVIGREKDLCNDLDKLWGSIKKRECEKF